MREPSSFPGVHQWQDPDTGRHKVLADGAEGAFTAISDALGKKGASTVQWRWDSPFVSPDTDDAPAGVPVTWTCTVVWRDQTSTVGVSGLTADHRRGMVEAGAEVLRQRGSTISFLELADG